MRNYYDILGLSPHAGGGQIREAYLKRMKHLHPDTGASPDPEHLRLVMEAYRVLSDPEQRQRYDSQLGLTPQKTVRKLFKKTRTLVEGWLSSDNAAEEVPKKIPPSVSHHPPAPVRSDFSRTLQQMKEKGEAPFERGEDGVIRRTKPAEELPSDTRVGPRPNLKRPGTLTKPTPWKLWQ